MSNLANGSAMARINALVDENSFVEIGGMVTARSTDFNMQTKETPGDGVITGYGVIEGKVVYIYSQDASVLGGTIGEMHAKKILKLYDMAMKVGAPVIGLVDCAGIRLQEAMDALNGFGEIYLKQTMASGVIPQITAVYGMCGGGMGIVAEMSDFTFMSNEGKLFINTPNALSENNEAKCDTASAKYNALNGIADFIGTEEEIAENIRKLVIALPSNYEDCAEEECTDDLNRVCDGIENYTTDTEKLISCISDDNFEIEVKKEYAREMVTSFIKLNGETVGAVANRTAVLDEQEKEIEKLDDVLTVEGCKKASEFINFCDAFGIPVVSFTNVTGFKATKEQEKEMAVAAAKLTAAFAKATIPKVNVVIGNALGNAYNVMNSKATGADIVYAWPQAKIGTMDSENAVRIMYADEISNSSDKLALINEKKAEYETLKESAVAAAKRGYVDSIIESIDTRKYIIGALEMLYTKADEQPAKKHSTI